MQLSLLKFYSYKVVAKGYEYKTPLLLPSDIGPWVKYV